VLKRGKISAVLHWCITTKTNKIGIGISYAVKMHQFSTFFGCIYFQKEELVQNYLINFCFSTYHSAWKESKCSEWCGI
jgi:hypothetical protein